MKAVEFLEKLRETKGKLEFDSEYSSVRKIDHFTFFDVNDEKVFLELTEEEKLEYSTVFWKRPVLIIHKNQYIFVEEYQT